MSRLRENFGENVCAKNENSCERKIGKLNIFFSHFSTMMKFSVSRWVLGGVRSFTRSHQPTVICEWIKTFVKIVTESTKGKMWHHRTWKCMKCFTESLNRVIRRVVKWGWEIISSARNSGHLSHSSVETSNERQDHKSRTINFPTFFS